jgi:hypothetical protein
MDGRWGAMITVALTGEAHILCTMCLFIYVLIIICDGESPFSEADTLSASQKI